VRENHDPFLSPGMQASEKSDIDIRVYFSPSVGLLDLSGLFKNILKISYEAVYVGPKRAIRKELNAANLTDTHTYEKLDPLSL
jgi:predicted nucleotidyltransferase